MNDIQLSNFRIWTSHAESLRETGFALPALAPHIQIPSPRILLEECFVYCLHQIGRASSFQFTPELEQVSLWLSDNHHKGLFLYGNCGRGKTFLCRYVLPLIFHYAGIGILDYYDMTFAARHTDQVLASHFLVLDDIGTEQRFNDYGTIRHTLDEVVDSAEKQGKLLIITTNLTGEELQRIYGERVYDRLLALTHRILFSGASFRPDPTRAVSAPAPAGSPVQFAAL